MHPKLLSCSAWIALLVLSLLPRDAPRAEGPPPSGPGSGRLGLKDLRAQNARFAPVEVSVPDRVLAELPESERQALASLIGAARIMDAIHLRQVYAGNPALLMELLEDRSPLGQEVLRSFLINKGPWLQLDQNRPFVPFAPLKPGGAGFYPGDARKAEIEAWLKTLPEDRRRDATSFFTTIRRGTDGKLITVPYSVEYQGELIQAAHLIREAASYTQQPTLRDFLMARARAFLSNDYYESDLAWMHLDASIEPTIGPYEVYEDTWFNAKAAFQAYITLRDAAESERLGRLSVHLQDIEDNLPIDPRLKNPRLGALAPIRVVNSIFASGDGRSGVQTAAFNLPNDERIVKEKGSKRIMLKNVQEAKFHKVLVPISKIALSPADQKRVSFDAFFTHILMHELMHGLGPHEITVRGRKSTVRKELEDAYSAIEEAKADIAGLFALDHLIRKGVIERSMERVMYTTFLASTFRSVRFGLDEAHGKGVALQLGHLMERGAVRVTAGGTFTVDETKIRDAVADLTRELMTIQGEGDRERARALLDRLAVVRPEVSRVLSRLGQIPVDIEPRFSMAARLYKEMMEKRRAGLAQARPTPWEAPPAR